MSNKQDILKDLVKFIALCQLTLEQMDKVKGTPLYKQSIKKKINNLEKDLEWLVREPNSHLDNVGESMMNLIQNQVEVILGLNVDEIAGLQIAVKEHRESTQETK